MPVSTPSRLLTALLASAASLAIVAATGPVLAQQQVGTAAAVNPRSTSGPSGARVLELGSRIIHRERIETSASGSVQVLFVDKTTLNIGPGSSLLIDEFVYNPDAGAGSMALSMTRGAMRFVGGNASHTGGAMVKTPVATIGIRGGVTAVRHRDGETKAILQFGTLTVTGPAGEEVILRRPGFMVTVDRNGISPPMRVPQGEIDAIIAETRSRQGQTGGRRQPTPDLARGDAAGSHPCSMPVQGQTTLDLAAATCRSVNTQIEREADDIVRQAVQQNPVFREVPQPYGYFSGGPPVIPPPISPGGPPGYGP